MDEIIRFINGAAFKSAPERRQDVFNPATGAAGKTLVLAGVTDVDTAVAAAKAA